MSGPRIILSTRRVATPHGSLVIDLATHAFGQNGEWRGFSEGGRTPFTTFRVICLLALRAPGCVERHTVVDFVWADSEDGGPIDPIANIRRHIHGRKDLLDWLGLRVKFRQWYLEATWDRAEARAAA